MAGVASGRWLGVAVVLVRLLCGLAMGGPAVAQQSDSADALSAEVVRLYKAGKFAEGVPLAQRALALREKALGPGHPVVATGLNNLAELYGALGRYSEAEPLCKRALAIAEKALGPDHPDVGSSLNNLAELYRKLGRYAEAEPLYKRATAIYEKVLGRDHPLVGTSINNLALLYWTQGRHPEAEPLYKRALAIAEKALGPDHPNVGTSLINLAALYVEQGRFAEAELLYKRSVGILQKALGADHPLVATNLDKLAMLYGVQSRYSEAEPLCKRALAIAEKALGPDHPDVGIRLNNLAELYRKLGRYAEAEPLYKRALAIAEKALGRDHPHVGTSINNLAELYGAQGRYTEAEPLQKRALAIAERALGPDHPDVGIRLSNLAALYGALSRYAEAEPLYKRALAIAEKALGPDHPDVGIRLNNLATLYGALRRYAEAEPLQKRALAITERALGPDHPEVGTALSNLAVLALDQQDLVQAAKSWRASTALIQRRVKRGLGDTLGDKLGGGIEGDARAWSWQFAGLIKVTHRLTATDRGEWLRYASEMFEAAQWGQGSEAAQSLAQMAARSAKGSPDLAALVRERQDLVGEWQAKDKSLIVAKSQPPERRDAKAEQALVDRLGAIDTRMAAIDARLAKDFQDYAALASPKPTTVTDVQAALRDDEALLLFLDTDARFKPLPEETFAWVVTKREVRWLRSELGTAALKREVTALRCGLDTVAWSSEKPVCSELTGAKYSEDDHAQGKPLPFDTGRAHRLYKSLLGDAADVIKGKQLLVVASGALTTLPFQVLVTKAPASSDLKSVDWLIRDHAITVLPSVASLAALRRTGRPSSASKAMIGFGNPLLDGNQQDPQDGGYYKRLADRARAETGCAAKTSERTAALRTLSRSPGPVPRTAGLADLAHLKRQTPLPETADELCNVARSIGADSGDIRIGARATETEIKRLSTAGDLAQYRIVHFATHGTLAGQLKGTSEPGLILTPPEKASPEDDGYLSSSEIASLKLDADWVILSACNTAGGAGQGEAAEALSGLARAFFYAGARALLVSHWEVDSAATVKLITNAVGALAKDRSLGRAEALRRAVLAVMTDTSRPANWVPASHPAVWAPFVVVGEGGAGR